MSTMENETAFERHKATEHALNSQNKARDMILSRAEDGQQIDVETEELVARECGLNETDLQRVLGALQADGLLVYRPTGYVKAPTQDEVQRELLELASQ
ncbi:hypothetical protein BMF89_16555 [Arthrobacter sp. SRS-W-1-2016]|uniref:hypothetical protein n=1 Tax=Arthrobacter sp. SRS-W-1-2016 TaxID=1930254 RepID=UPI000990CE28|nr:hypothetical protein [Arthrobacter sp. SRS-W-1-2016]OOP60480.1 hypothetical protein BMF89_16555 [Arthrobacter sp. SRS-W-1-2016]